MVNSLTATAAVIVVAISSLPTAVEAGRTLWYPDYASSYERGRCTNAPSSSLLKLASYASSGYEDQEACCQNSFPGQENYSYCSCMGGCSSLGDLVREDYRDIVEDDDDFDVDVVYDKLMNETQAFDLYQAEQEKYWSTLTSLLPSLPSWVGSAQTEER